MHTGSVGTHLSSAKRYMIEALLTALQMIELRIEKSLSLILTRRLRFHSGITSHVLKPLTGHGFHGKQIRIFTLHGVIAVESAI